MIFYTWIKINKSKDTVFKMFAQETKKPHSKHNQLTFSVQHLGDVQVFLSHFKGVVQIGHRVVLKTVPGDTDICFYISLPA